MTKAHTAGNSEIKLPQTEKLPHLQKATTFAKLNVYPFFPLKKSCSCDVRESKSTLRIPILYIVATLNALLEAIVVWK